MTDWKYTYRRGQIPAKAILHEHTPGQILSDVVTELQEKAITEVDVTVGGGLKSSVVMLDGMVSIDLSLDETSPASGGDGAGVLPDGTEEHQVLTWNGSEWVAGWVRAHEVT